MTSCRANRLLTSGRLIDDNAQDNIGPHGPTGPHHSCQSLPPRLLLFNSLLNRVFFYIDPVFTHAVPDGDAIYTQNRRGLRLISTGRFERI